MRWPSGLEPQQATVYARNELVIPATPERIWRWLCHAARWPEWYSNCGWIIFPANDGPDLVNGTRFIWKTFGVRVRSTVLGVRAALGAVDGKSRAGDHRNLFRSIPNPSSTP